MGWGMFGKRTNHILVIKTDGLASFVAAEPVYEALRAAHPDSLISLLTTPDLQRVAKASPYFDQVAALPPAREPENRRLFLKHLKGEKFARVYDLSGDADGRRVQNALGPFPPKWFAAAPAKRGGARDMRGQRYVRMLASAGVEERSRLPDFSWALTARKGAANMEPSWFGVSGPFGLLSPAADPRVRWSTADYAALAREMGRAGMTPVVVGARDIHEAADDICHEAPEAVDLVGKCDHLQLVALAHEAAFFVSDDAEEIHLALSAGCPGVLIKRSPDASPPQGRNVVVLTVAANGDEPDARFVWRTLENMQLTPQDPEAGERAFALQH
ncbi:MAG: glycosyltransferase family 9 protein [Pseudomonadota bacterium]